MAFQTGVLPVLVLIFPGWRGNIEQVMSSLGYLLNTTYCTILKKRKRRKKKKKIIEFSRFLAHFSAGQFVGWSDH